MLRIGEILLKMGYLTEEALLKAVRIQKEKGGKIGEILVDLGIVKEKDIYEAISRQFGIPYVELKEEDVEVDVIDLLPIHVIRKYNLMPIRREGNTLIVALSDPTKAFDLKEVKLLTGCDIQPIIARENVISNLIKVWYEAKKMGEWQNIIEELDVKETTPVEVVETKEEEDFEKIARDAEKPPVIRIVNALFFEALKANASDIHIEPFEGSLRVRFRVDGMLHEIISLKKEMKDAVISRIKVLSRMDIAEKRIPQDGRIRMRMKVEGKLKDVDVRVSSTPTIYGEKIVMRILDKEGLMLDLSRLGFEPESLKMFEEAIYKPWGMILVTGPTGSGKTNTLYSAISKLNTPEVNIMTVEDPVEFNIKGINQVQVNESIGLTFSSVLRSFLRQDPNIILVGEIRDNETAEIAVKASLTGHLVLSTLHTNDAPQAIARLIDMGIDPYLVATSLILVVAQRLVRRICQECKDEVEVSPKVLKNVGFLEEEMEGLKIYKGKGCKKCGYTGYKGRIGIFEVMPVSETLKELIFSGAGSKAIRAKAEEEGMISLRRSGLIKIKNGITTIEEVLRETF